MVPDIVKIVDTEDFDEVFDTGLHLEEDQLEIIEQMSACNYTAESIAIYLSLDVDSFMLEFYNQDSEVYRRYHKGQLQSNFEINNKLREGAIAGNLTQTQQFEKHKKQINVENLKNKFFG